MRYFVNFVRVLSMLDSLYRNLAVKVQDVIIREQKSQTFYQKNLKKCKIKRNINSCFLYIIFIFLFYQQFIIIKFIKLVQPIQLQKSSCKKNIFQKQYSILQVLKMRRPQSAKPGYKNYWGQNSESDFQQNDNLSRGNHRKNVKLMKPDLTTNDFARILPKKIYQDKQRLYSQALQLKQNLNETIQQNIRLKTRITILQKQKDKLTKHIDVGRQNTNMNKMNSRVNIYNNKGGQKQNMMIRNLKKMVRESKEQNQFLKQENAKTKKAIKYTKINQLQIQRKMLQQENKRMANLLEQMNNQLANQESFEQEVNDLKRYLTEQQEANRDLNQANLKSMQYIQELEQKIASQAEKFHNKENKMQRQMALNKRKMNEALKQAENLRRQLNNYKQQSVVGAKSQVSKKVKPMRPMSSNPYKSQGGLAGVRMTTQSKKQQNNNNKQNQQQIKIIQLQNQQLKQQLSKTKSKLQETQRQFRKQRERSQLSNNQQQLNKVQPKASNPGNDQKKNAPQSKKSIPESNKNIPKNENKKNIEESRDYDEYENQFDNSPQKKEDQNQYGNQSYQKMQDEQQTGKSKVNKTRQANGSPDGKSMSNAAEIDKYRKDFEQEQQEEPLYIKEDESNKKKKRKSVKTNDKNAQKQKQKGKKQKNTGAYKPDKKILTEIKQILTYRMKAQRYPFEQLKRDIQEAKQQQFSVNDLQGMFINQPFYLTQKYTDALVQYCLQKQKPKATESVNSQTLLTKIRKVIDNFTLVEQKQEQQMLLRIAQMVTQYPQELEQAFQKIKNGQQTVARKDLIEMFKNLELEEKYIELIIQELSLCSLDLEHLNFIGFFERFYVENMEGVQNGQIDEEQMESSSQQVSKNLKAKDSKKIKQIKHQFQDDDQNLVQDDGQKISLGNDRNQYKDDDIVSDDGPV